MEIKFTKDELKIIIHALYCREQNLIESAEGYEKTGNNEMSKKCYGAWRETTRLHDKVQDLFCKE